MSKKKKTKDTAGGDTVRTTLSLSPIVRDWADEIAEEEGYKNFSAFIAALIRSRRERRLELEATRKITNDLASRAAKQKED